MDKRVAGAIFFLAMTAADAQEAPSAGGLETVRALGRLNGEALACGQLALVDRMRIGVVHDAPKTREVGEAFESATNERYLALGSADAKDGCSDGRSLAGRVDAAMRALRDAFAASRTGARP